MGRWSPLDLAAPVAALGPALGDRADLLDAVLVGRHAGAEHTAEPGAEAAPDGAQGPVAQQVAAEVDLVVSGPCRG